LGLGLGAQNEALESSGAVSRTDSAFVPPLVFASAINIDCRLLIRSLPDAGCTGTAAINGDHRLILIDPLTLPQALLFRSVDFTTDPVASLLYFKNWVSKNDSVEGKHVQFALRLTSVAC